MLEKRLLRSGLILAIALVLSGMIAFAQISGHRAQTPPAEGLMTLAGPFSVRDQNGRPFTEQSLRGHYSLVYFGFTSCPAICPTELQKINIALKTLGPAGEKIQPVFITIDPARDTQKLIGPYAAQFGPRLLGLTGTQEEIDTAIKAFRVYARKVEDPKLSDYTMDHSSYIYWVDPKGTVLSVYGPSSTSAELAAAIRKTLGL